MAQRLGGSIIGYQYALTTLPGLAMAYTTVTATLS